MIDDRKEPPDQPKTTQLPVVPQWAIELTAAMKDGLRELSADIKLVSNDLSIVKDRVGIIESWKNDQDARAHRASDGVRQLSTTDAAHDAQLAQERMAREELAAKVDSLTQTQATQLAILGRLDAIAKNPLAKTVAAMLATALVTWLASHGVQVPR